MFEKEKLEKYCISKSKPIAHPSNYSNGLSRIEEEFNVSLDEEFEKDKCESLKKRIRNKRIDSSTGKRTKNNTIYSKYSDYISYLKVYISFKSEKTTDKDKNNDDFNSVNYYIASANSDPNYKYYYDHWRCFEKYGYIDWGDKGKYLNIGGIVYIYSKQPVGKIQYKTKVIKVGIKDPDGDEFWKEKPEKKSDHYVRLQLISKATPDDLKLNELKEKFGFNPPQGGIKSISAKDKAGFIQMLESRFAESYEYTTNLNENEIGSSSDSLEKSNNKGAVYYSYYDVKIDCLATNKIFYGTPGCGKSYYVSHNVVSEDQGFDKDCVFRTTFHQDYSNVDFIGQVVPKVKKTENGSEVSYEFVPGPFTLSLEKAIDNPTKKVALVIEELNRGNAASIFGDIFQLLDRIEEDGDAKTFNLPLGTSQYAIVNVGISNYFRNRDTVPFELNEIRLPANLFVYATMNTSDQNVFTLDTAFKRRWESEKLSNNFDKEDIEKIGRYHIPCAKEASGITWKEFVEKINYYMVSKGIFSSEDKQIGKYFVSKKILCDKDYADKEKATQFAYKVLEYIWSDVAKFKREEWFGGIKDFDSLIDAYLNDGITIFNSNIFKKDNESVLDYNKIGEVDNED